MRNRTTHVETEYNERAAIGTKCALTLVELKTWWMSRNITSVMNDKLHDYDTTHYVLCISLIVLVWWYFVYTYPRTTFLYTKSTQTKETCLESTLCTVHHTKYNYKIIHGLVDICMSV
eukprot:534939_1